MSHPTLHVTQRRRPQLQRRFDRSSRHPTIPLPNHGVPWSQNSKSNATVMLGRAPAHHDDLGRPVYRRLRIGRNSRSSLC
jgi:hypothetical protein